ncbi:5-bromo-4-chloroindolyl phosphate hydrolysis family protein [Roseovarius amoyensis]|uniref:5-bromo-4-chloroindolyl phosphate hydrolysis family protein n=1 Tax=Roseovarius amoyensis TaxID=2211448 RepID=UPI000DBE1FF6|nr:5-bromo-4-chloroindolyl phosphate hydrolysis family protein [Roseovarius amoyensis]
MARRYGGKFSPDGQDGPDGPTDPGHVTDPGAYRGAVRTRAGGRVNLLFLAPLPLIWAAFTSGPTGLVLNLAALGLLLLAAWLTREGLRAQEAYEARKVARRPAFPRKIAGSIATGLGLGLAGFAAAGGAFEPVIYAVVGAALHVMAFGLDPLRDKGMEGIDAFQTDRVARAVDKAESYLKAMADAVRRAGDRQAEGRVERFQASVREMLRTVENDPRDLTAARKYLTVYLMGARDATAKFADIYAHSRDATARENYFALLSDLEGNFAAKTRALLDDDTSDLEVEIEVLRDRLKREGIRPATPKE